MCEILSRPKVTNRDKCNRKKGKLAEGLDVLLWGMCFGRNMGALGRVATLAREVAIRAG